MSIKVLHDLDTGTITTSSHGSSANWKNAYDNYITGISITGTTTKTITLTQRDGGTISDTFTDNSGSGGITMTNGANDRVVTATGIGGVNGEAGLLFGGSYLEITPGDIATPLHVKRTSASTRQVNLLLSATDSNSSSEGFLGIDSVADLRYGGSSNTSANSLVLTEDNLDFVVSGSTNNAIVRLAGGGTNFANFTIGGLAGAITVNSSSNSITIGHHDTSSAASVNNSGNTVIQDVTLDTYGHVTALASKSLSIPTVNDATLTVQGTGALSGSGTFTANQSTNATISISHDDTSSQSSVNNSGRTYIQDITLDGYGHVTGISSATETVTNTDTNNYLSSASFNTGNGVLTLNRSGLSAVTVDLDNRYAYYDHIRSLGTQAFTAGSNPNITTAQLIGEIESDGGFDSYSSVFKTSWSYAGNYNLSDAGRFTETAGTSWITWTDNSNDSTRGNITALAICPTTGGSAGKVFIYNDQGSSYAPGWREVWTNTSDGAGSGLDADLLDGQQGSYYLNYNNFTNTPTIPTVNNATLTVQGTGALGGSGTFTANQSSNTTISISHDDTSSQSSINNSNGTVIQDVTLDGYGHVTGLGSVDLDGRYFRRYQGSVSNVSNSGYTTAFTINGGNLASHISFSVQGTTSNVVVSNLIDLNVNHHQDIMLEALSGVYTQLSVKVISNNNEDFAVQLKTNHANAATLYIEIVAYGAEVPTFTSSHSFTGATLEATLPPGKYIKGNGGDSGDLEIAGVFRGDGSGLTSISYNDLDNKPTIPTNYLTNDAFDQGVGLYLTGGSYNAGTDTATTPLVIDEGDFIKTKDGGYLRNLIGKTTGDIIQIGQSGTSLIDQINFLPGTGGNSAVKVNGNTVWNAGNDGSGSGLDADTLDGNHASAFLTSESDTLATVTGRGASTSTTLSLAGGVNIVANPLRFQRSSSSQTGQDDNVSVTVDDSNIYFTHNNDADGDASGFNFRYSTGGTTANLLNFSASSLTYKGNTIWHSGNDGSGSNLDADKLDGQQGSYYLDYNNFTNTPSSSGISQSDADTRYVNATGDTMSGTLNMGGNTLTLHTSGGSPGLKSYYGTVNVVNGSSAGTLYVGTGNANASGSVYATTVGGGSNTKVIYSTSHHRYFVGSSTEEMRLESDGDLHVEGDVTAYSTTVSDIRLKDNVETIDNALDKVCKLRGVEYTWNRGSRKDTKDLGVIAQEVEKVLPEIVKEKKMPLIDDSDTKYKSVDYEKITAVLVEAVKEQQAQIDELTTILEEVTKQLNNGNNI